MMEGDQPLVFNSKHDEIIKLRARVEALGTLLQRLHNWDHMDTAADGPFWRREIASVLAKLEPVQEEGTP